MKENVCCYIQCCAALVVCVLGVNSTLGNSIECEDDDDRTGVCQVEFTLYVEECRPNVGIRCSFEGDIFDPEGYRLMCTTVIQERCWLKSARMTAWVYTETEEEREQRIVDTVDNHVVYGIRHVKYELCDSKYKLINRKDELTREQCIILNEVFIGLVEPVGGKLRKLRPAEDNELNWRLKIDGKWEGFNLNAKLGKIEYYHPQEGEIILDIRELEYSKLLKLPRDKAIVKVHVHERIHLADQMLHGPNRKWAKPDHNEPDGKKDDEIYKRTAWIYPLVGIPSLDWSRGCHPPYKLLGFLAGWGHDMSKSNDDRYCRVGEIIRH